jgi:hypothetical protein
MSDAPIILIAYPEEWVCYSKLARKLTKILANQTSFKVIYPHDKQGLLNRFFSEDQRVVSIESEIFETKVSANYVMIFDDGVSFEILKSNLNQSGCQLRTINVSVTRVVNIDSKAPYDVYIGRGSGFGNPYAIGIEGDDRDEVIRKFQYDFDRDFLRDHFKQRLLAHQGKILGCHCKPLPCHGDVLADFLNAYDDGL